MTWFALGLLNSSVPAYGEKPGPNVIVIFCDDLGYSYQLQHLPDMMGKPKPSALLVKDYYKDNISDPEKKEEMIRQLESLLQGDNLQ